MSNQNSYDERIVKAAKKVACYADACSQNNQSQKYQDSSLSHLSSTSGIMMNIMNRIGEENDFKFDLIDEIATLRGRKDTVKFSFDNISNDSEIELRKKRGAASNIIK